MGTTLTGTTPQDTYDSLIKVTNNGPLSSTARYLSDGLGNDSALALSTGNIGIGTTAPSVKLDIVGSIRIDEAGTSTDVLTLRSSFAGVGPAVNVTTSSPLLLMTANTERMRITSAGNVGIGTSTPSTKLTIDNSANAATRTIDLLGNSSTAKGHLGYFADNIYLSSNYFFESGQNNDTASLGQALIVVSASATNSNIQFATSAAGSTAPSIRATIDVDGLKFGTDTAAANALDDYEEGTWTMGVSFGGASVGVTYALNLGTYTKIGRQVTVTGVVVLSSKGSSTGSASITGLPFTVGTGFQYTGSAALRTANITFTDSYSMEVAYATTTIGFTQTTTAGALTSLNDTNFANNANIAFTATYFV
jgi:hypothetical protein